MVHIGATVSGDYVRDKKMIDEDNVVIFSSDKDEYGCRHHIIFTLWKNKTETAHTFEYCLENEEGGFTTEVTAMCPLGLSESIPEQFRLLAEAAGQAWNAAAAFWARGGS